MDPKTRLRKACDACSIRKVKVGLVHITPCSVDMLISSSVILVVRHVARVLLWIFLVHMKDPAGAGDLLIAMRRR